MATLSNTLENAINEVKTNPRIAELAKELAQYNLGISIPHIHNQAETVGVLPENIVQQEIDQKVSFIAREKLDTEGGFPVAWRYNKEEQNIEFCSWCCQN